MSNIAAGGDGTVSINQEGLNMLREYLMTDIIFPPTDYELVKNII